MHLVCIAHDTHRMTGVCHTGILDVSDGRRKGWNYFFKNRRKSAHWAPPRAGGSGVMVEAKRQACTGVPQRRSMATVLDNHAPRRSRRPAGWPALRYSEGRATPPSHLMGNFLRHFLILRHVL